MATEIIDTITCDGSWCEDIVADDLGDGWVRARGAMFVNASGQRFCGTHADEGTEPVYGEVYLPHAYTGGG